MRETIALLPAGVKQAAERMWEQVTAATLSELLDLVEFSVTHFEIADEVLYLKCERRFEVAQCPRCHHISEGCHQQQERCVRDLSLSGKRVMLYFMGRRFGCDQCQRPFTESLLSVGEYRRQTRRYERFIYDQCLASNRKALAQQEHLSESTVKVSR